MEDMMKDFEKYKNELKEFLYPEDKETKAIDETELKKILYKLLKYCLLTREYQIKIGNYEIDMTPQNLGVIYRTDGTYFEISNDDFYERTERSTEIRYFVCDTEKEEYPTNSVKYLEVRGSVLNINGKTEEHYYVILNTKEENDLVKDYLNVKTDAEIREDGNQSLFIVRRINRNDSRTDIYDYLDQSKVLPAYLDIKENKFTVLKEKHKKYEPNNYTELIPDQSARRKIAKDIYSSMVDYYTRYMKENIF